MPSQKLERMLWTVMVLDGGDRHSGLTGIAPIHFYRSSVTQPHLPPCYSPWPSPLAYLAFFLGTTTPAHVVMKLTEDFIHTARRWLCIHVCIC